MLDVLVVEDSDNDFYILKYVVGKIGSLNILHRACDGLKALDFLKQHQPHIILMDIQMPNMDGISCLKEIKSSSDLKHIPVIMLSSNVNSIRECFSNHASGYIIKPSDINKFIDLLNTVYMYWSKNSI